MDVKTLYTLIAVADHGSFAKGGRAVGLSLSGVSVQMRALEDDVQLTLFDRSKRPPVLTEEGRDFVNKAREVVASWESLSSNLRKNSNTGVLKIGAVHSVVSGVLSEALLRLREAAPGLDVRLTTGLTHELEAALRGGRIDVAIATEPEVIPPDIDFRVFCEERLVVIANASAHGENFREILENNPYVRFARMARVSGLIEQHLSKLGISVNSQMEIDTLESVTMLVQNGLGISIVPERRGAYGFPPSIRVFPFGEPPAMRRLGILASTNNARRHFVDQLFAALEAASRQEP